MKDDIMSISEQEKAQLFQCERRMAIMIAAKAASSTEGANHDIMSVREPTCLHDWRTAKCFPDVHLTTSAIKGVNLYDTEKEIRKNLP